MLNAAFGLSLASAAEARAWLNDGDGWQRLEGWIREHRRDFDHEEQQPEHEGEP